MPRRYVRRAALVLGGFAFGIVCALILTYVYVQTSTDARLAERVRRTIDLPAELLRVEALEGDSIARIALRQVELRDRDGAAVVAAPTVRLTLSLASLGGDGPIEIREVLLTDPTVNYVQYANGSSNLESVVAVTAGGREVQVGPDSRGRGVVIRNLRIAGGDIQWTSPYVPDSLPIAPRARAAIRLTRVGGTLMRVRSVRDLDAWIPSARFGGTRGWRVEVASATARLTDPELRVVALAGSAEEAPEDGIRFALNTLRTEHSTVTGSGVIRLAGETPQFDVTLRTAPLDFRDLRWFVPSLPEGGRATGQFALASRPDGRTEVSAEELVVTAYESRITGRFSALVGGERPAAFWDTQLALDPLRLETIEQLGLVEDVPYTGEVRGSVASAAATVGEAAPLQVDLAATFAPEQGGVPTSTVFMRGPVTVGGEAPLRFAGLQVTLQPLHLMALRAVAPPEQHERLRGVLRGTATLTGTPQELRVEDGDLAYEVGGGPRTRLTGITLDLRTRPELRFTLQAQAAPLALGTLSELFPAFPFRTATFAGPIRIEGTPSEFRIDTELSGAAGLIAIRGTIAPGDPVRFDLSGRVASFNTQVVMDRPAPVQGPVTGTFAAAGNANDFRFNVDMLQEGGARPGDAGRFALNGTFRRLAGADPILTVAGEVVNFNLGALIGRPAIFASRMTGQVQLAGGGREPYRFNLDLRGTSGALDVEGWYAPGTVPSYQVVGTVAGLNLRHLPGGETLPVTSLNAAIDIRGQGTTLETLAGDYRINASRSTVAGRPLDALQADLAVREGIARVDTLEVALAGTRLSAAGTWGLTRSTPEPLSFSLVSRDLSQLAPLLPDVEGVDPQTSGSFTLEGTVSGSMRLPVVDVAFHGDNLRYESWRARELEFDLAATLGRSIQQITGELALTGDGLELGGRGSLATLRLGLEGGGSRVAVRMAAVRDENAALSLTGALDLQGGAPRGMLLDSLDVRTGDVAWQLANPTELRWGGTEGVRVTNLLLRRAGGESGTIAINGAIPPDGTSDLQVNIVNLDLGMVRQLMPSAPALAGVVHLNATLQGPVTDPELSLQGSVRQFQYEGVAADSISLSGRYDERLFTGNAGVWTGGLNLATAEGAIPMQLSFQNSLPTFELLRTEPLRARIVADSLPIALIAASSSLVRDPTGLISTELTARGTIDRPQLAGWATVADGAVTIEALGLRYNAINGRVAFEDQVIRIDTMEIRSDGLATVNGTVRLVDLDRPELYLTANMAGFHAIQNEDVADLTMSGTVALSGRMPQPVLTGGVTLEQGVIYLPDYSEQLPLEITDVDVGQVGADTVSALAVAPTFVESVQVSDLNVAVEEGVWLESRQARVEIRGELVVFRTGIQPRFYGNLQAVRGTYALTIGPIVREFDVVSGSVRFFGTQDLNPELDITALHEVHAVAGTARSALDIIVRVTGTAEYPKVTLTSNTRPPLPESELLNYLVFGQPSFRLTQQQGFAQQLLVQELLGGLLVQELGHLNLPCQYLRLRGRPTELTIGSPLSGFGSTSLECGVQVLPDVFLTLETGVTSAVNPSNPLNALLGVSLDWQINDFVAARVAREPLRTGVGGLLFQSSDVPYQWSADVNGTWEFGHPRNSAPMEPDVLEPQPPGSTPPVPLPPPPTPAPAETPRQTTPPGQGSGAPTKEESGAPR